MNDGSDTAAARDAGRRAELLDALVLTLPHRAPPSPPPSRRDLILQLVIDEFGSVADLLAYSSAQALQSGARVASDHSKEVLDTGTDNAPQPARPARTCVHLLTAFLTAPYVRRTAVVLEEKKAPALPVRWYEPGEADANMTEVLFFALLLCVSATSDVDLQNWAKKVASDHDRAHGLRQAWKPLTLIDGENGFDGRGKQSKLFDLVGFGALSWPDDTLRNIARAMRAWDGEGACDMPITYSHLTNYIRKPPPGVRSSNKVSMRDAPPRWSTWIVTKVADLVNRRGDELRRVLGITKDMEHDDVLTQHERLKAAEALGEATERELQKEQKMRRRAEATARKQAARLKEKRPY